MENKFKLALLQMDVVDDKDKNIKTALHMLKEAYKNDCKIAALPEMFNCPYNNSKFKIYAESIEDSVTLKEISDAAKKFGMYIVSGSIPEICDGKLYNTSITFDNTGQIIAKHRKMHLFDIDVPGKIKFLESETLSPGKDFTVVDTEFCKIGIGICYDIRFPELFRLMALNGAKVAIVPAAFNMVTGPAHWEITIRTRALDNQMYVAAASPARNENASYIAYGNSMVSGPWGNVLARATEKSGIVFAEVDLSMIEKIRQELPLLKHRRTDIYDVYKSN